MTNVSFKHTYNYDNLLYISVKLAGAHCLSCLRTESIRPRNFPYLLHGKIGFTGKSAKMF